jgi:hypothetical protein
MLIVLLLPLLAADDSAADGVVGGEVGLFVRLFG